MASPMVFPLDAGVCCLCWGPHDGGTFDVIAPFGNGPAALVLMDVCSACRLNETRELIRRAPSRTYA